MTHTPESTPPASQSEALVDSSLIAKAAWNAFADEYSQWKVLSIEEQIHWVEAFASARAEGRREGIEEAAKAYEAEADTWNELGPRKSAAKRQGAKAIRARLEEQSND